MCEQVPEEERLLISWSILGDLMWVLRTELGSSGRTASALNHCVTSPVHTCYCVLVSFSVAVTNILLKAL